jgi:hypothetical protein
MSLDNLASNYSIDSMPKIIFTFQKKKQLEALIARNFKPHKLISINIPDEIDCTR